MDQEISNIQEQLAHWVKNAFADINQHVEKAAAAKGYTKDMIDGKKVILKYDMDKGKLEGFNMFTYSILDHRVLKRKINGQPKKIVIASVEFTPAGYVVFIEEPLIKVVKPKIFSKN